MKPNKTILVLLLVVACLAIVIYQEVADKGCPRPPKDFTENDLIGTWYFGGPKRNDTLIIRNDGTYKQIIHIEPYLGSAADYESDWQSWWMENPENGIPYLHLEGMRMCAHTSYGDCGFIEDGERAWWDFCEDETRYLPPGEGVLMVLGVPKRFKQPPRGIELSIFGIDEFPGAYVLIDN